MRCEDFSSHLFYFYVCICVLAVIKNNNPKQAILVVNYLQSVLQETKVVMNR
jgi:hypothetical protein